MTRNSPFERLYNHQGLLRRPYHKEKTKKAKDRMRQFMSPEDMHDYLSQILARSRQVTELSSIVHERLPNGMTYGDFCTGCILARWASV